MFQLRQQLLNFRTLFHGSHHLYHSSNANIRHVRFKRPWVKFVTTCLLYGAAFHLWSSFIFRQFDETLENAEAPAKALPDEKAEERNQGASHRLVYHSKELTAKNSFFIPLSSPHLHDGSFYSASDPEWSEFVRISRDSKRLQSLRDELASTVLRDASGSNILSQLLGGPLIITGSWLVHHFPSRAPPEYGLSGLEVGGTGISWTTRPISSEAGDRIRRCMQPVFVALAIRDAYLALVKRQFSHMGLHSPSQAPSVTNPSIESSSEAGLNMRRFDSASHLLKPPSQPSLSSKPHGSIEQQNNSWLRSSSILSSLQWLPLLKFDPDSDLRVAFQAFRWRLNDCCARELRTPRRGTFHFAGPIGLKGPNGFCRVEVWGEYDPSGSQWTNVSMQLKDLNIFSQRALGS